MIIWMSLKINWDLGEAVFLVNLAPDVTGCNSLSFSNQLVLNLSINRDFNFQSIVPILLSSARLISEDRPAGLHCFYVYYDFPKSMTEHEKKKERKCNQVVQFCWNCSFNFKYKIQWFF